MDTLKIFRISDNAIIPVRRDGDIGFDLFSAQDVEIPPAYSGQVLVGTGIAIRLPEGSYGRIAPRSGLALRFGLQVLGGVIDPIYTGEVRVILTARSSMSVTQGMRIAQLIVERALVPKIEIVNDINALGVTERGSNGFGSTGV